MKLSNKIRVIVALIAFALTLSMTTITCNDNQVIKQKQVITEVPKVRAGVVFAINEILVESPNETNVANFNRTETPLTAQPELASNGEPYVYYEVYDFFYGSDKYHSLDYELQKYTYELCIEYEIEEYYTLILCQLFYESLYKADAVSPSNDYGIAQINKCNHEWLSKELGITDFLDPEQSILCNIYMMSNNLKKYSVESSLFCYNTGKRNGSNTYSKNIIYMWNNGVKEIEE